MPSPTVATLLNNAAAEVVGEPLHMPWAGGVFQATIAGSGAVSATVLLQASMQGNLWTTIGTLSLSGTTSDTKTAAMTAPWPLVRADITAISGTGAKVNVYVAGGQ